MEVKALNQQVKRNIARFPEVFMLNKYHTILQNRELWTGKSKIVLLVAYKELNKHSICANIEKKIKHKLWRGFNL